MAEKKYGHFDDANREYVITDPKTPWPWINYLGNEDFFSLISNTAGGYSFYKDAKFRRITRYRYNGVPMDNGGRYFYIKDGDTVWNPGWKPCKTPLDSYECRHGMNYTRITGSKNGVEASVLFFVPLHTWAEVQKMTLKNQTEEVKTLKPHAQEAMKQLQEKGIEVYMMSGDKEEAAHYWAEKAGIKHYQSKVLPGDKQALVKKLQDEGKQVAMVGDGINDTQALALANVSMAIGKGTDVAMDVAQITLMSDDLLALPEAVKLSQKTVHMIWQNLFWAFIYNIICIPLAAGALHIFGIDFQITPMWASALMAFSSVSVVLNSLRLRLA